MAKLYDNYRDLFVILIQNEKDELIVTYVNEVFSQYYGQPRNHYLGKVVSEEIPYNDYQRFITVLMSRYNPAVFKYPAPGRKIIRWEITKPLYNGVNAYHCHGDDVTDRLLLLDEIDFLHSKLQLLWQECVRVDKKLILYAPLIIARASGKEAARKLGIEEQSWYNTKNILKGKFGCSTEDELIKFLKIVYSEYD